MVISNSFLSYFHILDLKPISQEQLDNVARLLRLVPTVAHGFVNFVLYFAVVIPTMYNAFQATSKRGR